MGYTLPFSSIDKHIEKVGPINGCIVDTQFLVASLYPAHTFNEDAEFVFEKLQEYRIPIFSTVTTRSEFIDIQRRITITEALMDMLSPTSTWKLSANTRSELMKQKNWIDSQGRKEELPILPDRKIKDCKFLFHPLSQSGHHGWLEICNYYLKDRLEQSWDNIVEALSINYIQLFESERSDILNEKVTWKRMYKISEETCMASSDAMITNVFRCSIFPMLISADFDMAYATTADSNEKVVFVPDVLYRKKVKFIGSRIEL
jgi:hypothetical protein